MKQLLWVMLIVPMTGTGFAAETILLADFSNKPIDQPIATGGAAQGEPVAIPASIDAVVRAAPGGGRELELARAPSGSTASVRFQFLESEEVTSGQVRATVAVRLGSADQFSRASVLLRETDGSAQSFLNFDLFSDGQSQIRRNGFFAISFEDTVMLSAVNVFEVLYDLDEAVISLCLNDELLASELASGIETSRGVGSVLFSLAGSENETLLWLDELEVEKGLFSGRLFADRFEYDFSPCPF